MEECGICFNKNEDKINRSEEYIKIQNMKSIFKQLKKVDKYLKEGIIKTEFCRGRFFVRRHLSILLSKNAISCFFLPSKKCT